MAAKIGGQAASDESETAATFLPFLAVSCPETVPLAMSTARGTEGGHKARADVVDAFTEGICC